MMKHRIKEKFKKPLLKEDTTLPRRWSDSEKQHLLELVEKGYSHDTIAKMLKRSYHSVSCKLSDIKTSTSRSHTKDKVSSLSPKIETTPLTLHRVAQALKDTSTSATIEILNGELVAINFKR